MNYTRACADSYNTASCRRHVVVRIQLWPSYSTAQEPTWLNLLSWSIIVVYYGCLSLLSLFLIPPWSTLKCDSEIGKIVKFTVHHWDIRWCLRGKSRKSDFIFLFVFCLNHIIRKWSNCIISYGHLILRSKWMILKNGMTNFIEKKCVYLQCSMNKCYIWPLCWRYCNQLMRPFQI